MVVQLLILLAISILLVDLRTMVDVWAKKDGRCEDFAIFFHAKSSLVTLRLYAEIFNRHEYLIDKVINKSTVLLSFLYRSSTVLVLNRSIPFLPVPIRSLPVPYSFLTGFLSVPYAFLTHSVHVPELFPFQLPFAFPFPFPYSFPFSFPIKFLFH